MRVAVCGGVYSNPYALTAFCEDARRRGAERLYCLGDLGGYGAEPDAVRPLLDENDVVCVAGNYDVAVATGMSDCGCGYQDPRDQQFAQLMFDYTVRHTDRDFAAWMGGLPVERRITLAGCDTHLVHGSPLGLNDFWWESLPESEHLARVRHSGAQLVLATHTGIPWIRRFGDALVVNVGVLGRPPNDGRTTVSYALVDITADGPRAEIVPLVHDWRAQVRSMRRAGLPEAFVHTNETGWWAVCLEVLPAPERARGRYHVYESSVPDLLRAAALPADSWPGDGSDLPVRSLIGSPLLPRRVWIERPGDGRDLAAADGVEGPWRAEPLANRGRPAAATGAALRACEPTLRADGWHRRPDDEDGPLVDPDTAAPVPADAPARAYQLLVEGLLDEIARVITAPSCPIR